MTDDTRFLYRTLELAARAEGQVAPNPMVGCVIVGPEGEVLAEGWHKAYGGLHAEREALAALPPGTSLAGCTVYVSLEPCAHFGKQPPCADKLVELRPARVVAATTDPNPFVAGQGFARLRAAGIDVQEGPLKREALVQNRRFVTRFWMQRPFVTLKWAQTEDGRIARADYSSKWITGPAARTRAHRARALHQAIAVGYRTALHDDPALDTRLWPGKSPVRVVADPKRALPATLKMFTDGGPTLHLYEGVEGTDTLATQGYQAIPVALGAGGWPAAMGRVMQRAGLYSLLVEGGSGLLNAFLQEGYWDEALVFAGPVRFGAEGIAAPVLPPVSPLQTERHGPDTAALYPNLESGFWCRLEEEAPALAGDRWQRYL